MPRASSRPTSPATSKGPRASRCSPSTQGSELHFTSELTPTNSVLRAVARLASPIARYGHEWVLNTGLEQFRSRAL